VNSRAFLDGARQAGCIVGSARASWPTRFQMPWKKATGGFHEINTLCIA
jgi:hypothetical protein